MQSLTHGLQGTSPDIIGITGARWRHLATHAGIPHRKGGMLQDARSMIDTSGILLVVSLKALPSDDLMIQQRIHPGLCQS